MILWSSFPFELPLEDVPSFLRVFLRLCRRLTSQLSRKAQNTVSIHPMVLNSFVFQYCLFTLPKWVLLQLTSSKRIKKSQYTVCNRGPRGKPHAQRSSWWAKCHCIRLPSKVCCGKVALQRANMTVKPLPTPTCVVSSSTYLFG